MTLRRPECHFLGQTHSAASGADRAVLYFHDERKYHRATANFFVGKVGKSILDLFLHYLLRSALLDGFANYLLGTLDQVFVLSHVDKATADDLRTVKNFAIILVERQDADNKAILT